MIQQLIQSTRRVMLLSSKPSHNLGDLCKVDFVRCGYQNVRVTSPAFRFDLQDHAPRHVSPLPHIRFSRPTRYACIVLNRYLGRTERPVVCVILARHRKNMTLAQVVEYILLYPRIRVPVQFLDDFQCLACLSQHL